MSELEQLKAILAEQRRERAERNRAAEHQERVRYRDNLMAGRATVDCECDYCLSEILACRTPNRTECARLKALARQSKQGVTHAVAERPFELKG